MTGIYAINYYKDKEEKLNEISKILKTDVNDSLKKAETLVEDLKRCNKEIEKLKSDINKNLICDIINKEDYIKGVRTIIKRLDGLDAKELRNIVDVIKSKIDSVFVVLASVIDDKIVFVAASTKDLVLKGVHAGNILKEVAKITGGGGGGRPDLAQAGGTDLNKLDIALEGIKDMINL